MPPVRLWRSGRVAHMLSLRVLKGDYTVRNILIVAFLLFTTFDANADVPASVLAKYCAEYPSSSEGSAICLGYVTGVLDAYRMVSRTIFKDKLFCETKAFTGNAAIQTVKDYLLAHPAQLSDQAASVILAMLGEKFPCK